MNLLVPAVTRTNILYGALNLQVTNIVFVHGSIDPWHVLGIIQSSNPQAPAIYIEGKLNVFQIFHYLLNYLLNFLNTLFNLFKGTAHCANMYPPSERDIPQLKEARTQIKDLIKQWLQN